MTVPAAVRLWQRLCAWLPALHAFGRLGDPKYRACPLLRRMVAAGHLGRKSGQGFYKY